MNTSQTARILEPCEFSSKWAVLVAEVVCLAHWEALWLSDSAYAPPALQVSSLHFCYIHIFLFMCQFWENKVYVKFILSRIYVSKIQIKLNLIAFSVDHRHQTSSNLMMVISQKIIIIIVTAVETSNLTFVKPVQHIRSWNIISCALRKSVLTSVLQGTAASSADK
jgi:hypothetical protein